MTRSVRSTAIALILLLVALGGIVTTIGALNSVDVETIDIHSQTLSVDEEAYYEYVSPRLDRLVTEVTATEKMVEEKSRDIVSLTRAGNVIDTLTSEIRTYGEENGVPELFADVHEQILSASDVVTDTFDQARAALRSFDFSQMSSLVDGFGEAADQFSESQTQLEALVPETNEPAA